MIILPFFQLFSALFAIFLRKHPVDHENIDLPDLVSIADIEDDYDSYSEYMSTGIFEKIADNDDFDQLHDENYENQDSDNQDPAASNLLTREKRSLFDTQSTLTNINPSKIKNSLPTYRYPTLENKKHRSKRDHLMNVDYVFLTGWGKDHRSIAVGGKRYGLLPTKLREAQLPLISHDLCKTSYEFLSNVSSVVCAGFDEKVGACQGDSGSPLQTLQNSVWYLYGVTSFGSSNGCALEATPNAYTRVTSYSAF